VRPSGMYSMIEPLVRRFSSDSSLRCKFIFRSFRPV
jgi:hypothetical protein